MKRLQQRKPATFHPRKTPDKAELGLSRLKENKSKTRHPEQ
jgi:hypothetical protein